MKYGWRVKLRSPKGATRNVVVDATCEGAARGLANERIGWCWDVIECVRLIDEHAA